MRTTTAPISLPDPQPMHSHPSSLPAGPHCVALSFPAPLPDTDNHLHDHPSTKALPAPSNFGRPRVRGLLKTARRSRPAPAPSDPEPSNPPSPPNSADQDPWHYLHSFSHDRHRKRPLRDESEHRDTEPWASPDPFSEYDDDSDSSAASLSRHHTHRSHPNHHHHYPHPPGKRRREHDHNFSDDPDPDYSPPTSTDDLLDEEIVYWDYSRKCNPTSTDDKTDSMWKTRSKLMDTSPIGGSGPIPIGTNARSLAAAQNLHQEHQDDRKTSDLEDWEFLKEMFANAAQAYETKPHSKTIPLLRGVINECHRFMKLFHDPSVIYTSPLSSPSSPGRKPAKDWTMSEKSHKPKSVSASTSTAPENPPPPPTSCGSANAPKTAEKKCKCKDLPTAFYTVLGTTLFFFGNIVDTAPELCLPGEPSNPVVYWLAALDAFEIGENLPVRTNGRNFAFMDHVGTSDAGGRTSPHMNAGRSLGTGTGYHSEPSGYAFSSVPEDWRMAVIWGRTLVAIAEELVRRQNERNKNPAYVAAQQAAEGDKQKDHERLVDALFSRAIVPQMPVAPAAPFAYGMPAYPFSVAAFFGGPRVPTLSGIGSSSTTAVPNNNADTPSWPPNSPLATLLSRRPPVPRRMSLESGVAPHQLLVLAQDQLSRGILHMPHPQHVVPARFGGDGSSSSGGGGGGGGAAKDKRPFSAFLPPSHRGSGHCHESHDASSSPGTHAPPAELPTFSRAKELYTIAYEVMLLSEKLESAGERQQWARWANSVFSQMKMEADTDVAKWRGLITGARGRCFVVVGTALAEGIEDRLEAAAAAAAAGGDGGGESEREVLSSEDAVDAREALNEAIGYLEKAKDEFEAKMALDAQGGVVVLENEKEGEEEEDEDEEMILENEDEDEDNDEVDVIPKPAGPASASASASASAPGGPAESMLKVASSDSPSKKSTSTSTSSSSPASATPATNPTASATAAAKTANSPEEEIEELKMLLAEVLLSLANLTANKREREQLYARAQAESGDKLMLDSDEDGDGDGDDEKMDETL